MIKQERIYNHPYFGEIYYTFYVREDLQGQKGLPLVIFLHGAGERGKDYKKISVNGPPKYMDSGLKEYPGIVVCPQCPEKYIWSNSAALIEDFTRYITELEEADKSRVSITGLSMGGYGTWEAIMHCPELYRKAAPICGGGTPWRTPGIKAEVWAFHGDVDPVIKAQNSDELVTAMRNAGLNPKLSIFHGVGHGSWDEAYLNTTVMEWLFS